MEATAWVLDVGHRARRFDGHVPPGTRPDTAMHALIEREVGVPLGVPIGLRALETNPELLYLMPRKGGDGFAPVAAWAAADDSAYRLYVAAMLGGWEPPTRAFDVFSFGDSPELAAKLAHLVTKGRKRGTTGWFAAAERDGSTVPRVGLVSIVTDGFGYPQCAIRTERVEHIRFRDVEARHAAVEGEGDGTLEDWREGHLEFFRREAAALGLTFTEEALLYFEHFRVIAAFGRADAASR